METIIEGLAQYGPLGLWTASLLWMNHQQRKDKKEEKEKKNGKKHSFIYIYICILDRV